MKPGYKTTEFYAMLAGIVVTLLVTTGVIGESDSSTWQGLLAELLPALGGIVAYIWSRTQVKRAN